VTSSSYTVELTDTASAVNVSAWDQVRAAGDADVFSSLRFLRAIEESSLADEGFWYCTVRSGSRPVAVTNLFLMRVDLDVLAPPNSRLVIRKLRPLTGRLLSPLVLFCGVPVSAGQRAVIVDPSCNVRAVLDLLEKRIREHAKQAGAILVCFKELAETDATLLERLSELGYIAAQTPAMYTLRASFASFDNYVNALRAQYRQDIIRSLRKARSRRLVLDSVLGEDAIARAYRADVHALYEEVEASAVHRLEQLPRDFFLALARQFPDDLTLTLATLGEEPVGCHWGLRNGADYFFLFCGLRYAANHDADVYFNLMYAELGNAFDAGSSVVQLGQTADEFKARLGASPSPRTISVRATNRVVNRLLTWLAPALFVEEAASPPKSIFRNSASSAGGGQPGITSGQRGE